MPLTIPQKPETLRPLSLSEEKALDEKIQALMDERDEIEVDGTQGLNHIAKRPKESVNRDISRLQQIKKSRGVVRAEGAEREEVMKEIKSLEDRLRKDMPTYDQYQSATRKHGVGYLKMKAWCDRKNSDEKFKRDVRRWQSLRRRCEPSDPEISNTIYLFPEDKKTIAA